MREEKDIDLWNRCLQGDSTAFEILYKRFYPLLYNYGMKLISDADLVKDTIQNLFVKLIQNHRKLSPTTYVKSYVVRAFRNKLYDTLQQHKITYELSEYEESFSAEAFACSLEWDDTQYQKCKELASAYKKLSPKQQEVLYLYYVNELKHEEIATILNINYQSSKNLLFRSVSKLRELFFLNENK